MKLSICELNAMQIEEFVLTVGPVFEHSPWIAERAWSYRPFQSLDHLYGAMVQIVQTAENPLRLSLLQAHPDLGTRLKVSDNSRHEQSGAGLDRLSQKEYEEFASLNHAYKNKFGFPFIMAVKGQNKEAILSSMRERLKSSYEAEYEKAVQEVCKIAAFRLQEVLE